MTKSENQLTAFWSTDLWPTYPSMIKWVQTERDSKLAARPEFSNNNLNRGMNVTIILLSASCIEGFLIHVLKSFESSLMPRKTMTERLRHDYLERVSQASFGDIDNLFILAMGEKLSVLIANKDLVDSITMLFRFRNGLIHAIPARYESYTDVKTNPKEFQLVGKYKTVEQYLIKAKLTSGNENIFSKKFTDHFAGLVEPYINTVISVLPKPNADSIKQYFKTVAYYDSV